MNVLFRYNNGIERRMGKRYADILRRMKRGTYITRDMQAEQRRTDEELTELRAQYQDVVGKRPFHGWDADELRARIASAGYE